MTQKGAVVFMKVNKITLDILDELLNYKYLETSYKIFWTEAILQEVYKGKSNLTFKELAIDMLVNAWEPIVNKGITFGRLDRFYRMTEEIQQIWNISSDVSQEDLRKLLYDNYDERLEAIIEELYEDTPYRLLEPLYEKALKGKKDSAKNAIISEQCKGDSSSFYKIDSEHKTIIVNPTWIKFIKSNKKTLDGWIRDKLAYFLERKAMKH